MTIAVLIERLQKRYGSVEAIKDVSFQVETGEFFGILGPNGAGKTTTLRCLCTLSRADGGRLEVEGISVKDYPRSVRQRLGYVAQEVALDKVLTGRELLELQADLYHLPRSTIKNRLDSVIELLSLGEWANQLSGTYSGGIRKRFDLAAGLLHQPKILVLDEPTVGLDIESRSVIWQFLRSLREQGITILMTSHYLEEVDALADELAIIDGGQVIAAGTPQVLKAALGGDRVTLRVREFSDASEAATVQALLRDCPGVRQVVVNQAQGYSLNLVIEYDGVVEQLRQQLATADLPVFALAQSRPSLDDVYLQATGRTLMDAELAVAGSRDPKAERKASM